MSRSPTGADLLFDEWTDMFGSERLTGGLLDRLTHHIHILAFDVPSYRTGMAQKRGQKQEVNRQE